ncbi:MAG: hypothetical protein JKY53_12460 [Flavobacteriales bacterium]|nr:hypothetical protein [Flavobacteriales bacterium]
MLSMQSVVAQNTDSTSYWTNGKLKFCGVLNEGLLNGPSIEYNEFGHVKSEGVFLNGDKSDEWKYYNMNNLAEVGSYQAGKKYGEWKEFNLDASEVYFGVYKDGLKSGAWILKMGEIILIKDYFQLGKIEGAGYCYYGTGEIKSKNMYRNGQYHGVNIGYHENGEISIRSNYKDGLQDGLQKHYSDVGKLIKEEIYKDGELIETKEY